MHLSPADEYSFYLGKTDLKTNGIAHFVLIFHISSSHLHGMYRTYSAIECIKSGSFGAAKVYDAIESFFPCLAVLKFSYLVAQPPRLKAWMCF